MDKGVQKSGALIMSKNLKPKNMPYRFPHWGYPVARLTDSGSAQPVVEVVFRIISQNRHSHASFITLQYIPTTLRPGQPPRTDLDLILQRFRSFYFPTAFCAVSFTCIAAFDAAPCAATNPSFAFPSRVFSRPPKFQ